MAEGAALVHDNLGSNVVYQHAFTFGDVDADFAAADRVVRRELRWPRATAAPLETNGAIVRFDPASGRMDVWSNTNLLNFGAWVMSATLGVAPHMLNFHPLSVGGSFGSKHFLAKQIGIAGALAKVTGRPVKFMEDRADNLLASDAQAPERAHVAELALVRRRHVPQPPGQGRRRLRRLLHAGHRGQHQPAVADRRAVPDRQRHLRRHRGADQQEPAGRAARGGLRRHQLGAGAPRRRGRRRAGRRPRRPAAAQPHPARRLPLQDPHRQLLRLRQLPGGAAARPGSGRPRPVAGRAGARPRRRALHRHRRRLRPAAQLPITPASSGSTTSARPPRSRQRRRACGCGSGPPAGSPPRCSRRSGATRRRR